MIRYKVKTKKEYDDLMNSLMVVREPDLAQVVEHRQSDRTWIDAKEKSMKENKPEKKHG
jgi:hypothetical protein